MLAPLSPTTGSPDSALVEQPIDSAPIPHLQDNIFLDEIIAEIDRNGFIEIGSEMFADAHAPSKRRPDHQDN